LEQNILPLTEATFYILLSLSSGRKHGYAILKDVSGLSGSTVELSISTLYGGLTRMLEQGLIDRVINPTDDSGGPGLPRKSYQLAELGRRILEAEMVRLRRQLQAGQQYLGQEPQP
jgi:PadR family transcriptional regulator PadR